MGMPAQKIAFFCETGRITYYFAKNLQMQFPLYTFAGNITCGCQRLENGN